MVDIWSYAVEFHPEEREVHAYSSALPEAIASGADADEAMREMQAALVAAVRGRIKDGMPLPEPDGAGAEHEAMLPAQLAAKASVYYAWKAAGLSKSDLARSMGRSETEARRILDPDHGTKLEHLEEAAIALGGRLKISFAA